MKSYTFHIHEMHCASCTVLTDMELRSHSDVESVRVHLDTKTVDVVGNFETQEEARLELAPLLAPHGYTLAHEAAIAPRDSIIRALPFAAGIIALFLVLQTFGLAGTLGNDAITPATALIIGFIASLSSCGAVVGSLLLSLTAHYANKGERIVPQLTFHGGRLIAFFVLGGLLGTFGSILTLGFYTTLILNIVVTLMLLALGMSLLNIARVKLLTLPAFVTKPITKLVSAKKPWTPFALGALTFFLPCGFTQSAQLYSLSLGTFADGAMFMSMFALGTLPVLLIISFLPLAFRNPQKKQLFNTVAGILVLFFALYTLYTTLNILI
ncbi:hypothetical protein A3C87_03355 [Candidatus Kaiserbacteria bacterium RIFCSPHIGHO2_02_FULL_49_34]|uniref:Uncharacterized protein n=1 Tax=Candidatus Kaiserbacteria bacterium RIFCSPHIGHO2_02_FULL_49_34 TaxID=1798491 RepID=A0A1F6DIE8_9BACT|nr:MAG: hypothetical protein A3C87_03355 [Candidatus Kaiserbacteria bacterium RIFCSPHIGHO2_02_FULL_49_34]